MLLTSRLHDKHSTTLILAVLDNTGSNEASSLLTLSIGIHETSELVPVNFVVDADPAKVQYITMSSDEAWQPSRKRRKTTKPIKPRRSLPSCTRCVKLKSKCDDQVPCQSCNVYQETCTRPPQVGTFRARSRAASRAPTVGRELAPTLPRSSERPSSIVQNGLVTPTDGQSVTSRGHDSDESESSGLRSVVYSNTPLNNDEDDYHGRFSTTSAAVPHSFPGVHDSNHANVSQSKVTSESVGPREDNSNGRTSSISPSPRVLPPNAANGDKSTSKVASPARTTNVAGRPEPTGLGITLRGDDNNISSDPRASLWTATNGIGSMLEHPSTTSVYGAAEQQWENVPIKLQRIDEDDDDDDSTLSDLPEYMYETPAHDTLLKAAANDDDSTPKTSGLVGNINSTERAQQKWFSIPIKAEPDDHDYFSSYGMTRDSMDRTPTHRVLIKAAPSDDEHESEPDSPIQNIKTAVENEPDEGNALALYNETRHETSEHRTASVAATNNDEAASRPNSPTCLTDSADRAAHDCNDHSIAHNSREVEKASGNTAKSDFAGESALHAEQDNSAVSTLHKAAEAIELSQDTDNSVLLGSTAGPELAREAVQPAEHHDRAPSIMHKQPEAIEVIEVLHHTVGSVVPMSTAGPELARESVRPAERNDRALSGMHEPPEVIELSHQTNESVIPTSTSASEIARNIVSPVAQNNGHRSTVPDSPKASEVDRNTAGPELPLSNLSPKLVNAFTAAPKKRDRPAEVAVDDAAEPSTKRRGRPARAASEFASRTQPIQAPAKRGRPAKAVVRSTYYSPLGVIKLAMNTSAPVEQNDRRISTSYDLLDPMDDISAERDTSFREARNAAGVTSQTDSPVVANSTAVAQPFGKTVGQVEQNTRHMSTSYDRPHVIYDTPVQRVSFREARNASVRPVWNTSGITSQTASPAVANDTAPSELARNTAVPTPSTSVDVERSENMDFPPSSGNMNFPRSHTGASRTRTSSTAFLPNTYRIINTAGPSHDTNTSSTALSNNVAGPTSNTNTASTSFMTNTAGPTFTTNTPGIAHVANTPNSSISLDTSSGTARVVNPYTPDLARHTHTDHTGHITNTAERSRDARTAGPTYFTTNTSTRAGRKWLGPSSLQVYTHWLEMALFLPNQRLPDESHSNDGYGDALELLYEPYMPHLPDSWPALLDAFFSSVTTLFPMIDQASVTTQVDRFALVRAAPRLDIHERPAIAIVYGCLALGARQLRQTDLERRYLLAASSLFAYLVAFPTLQSAQALLILVLGLRAQNKNGAAYHVLGAAIRTLQSIGAHECAFHDLSTGSLGIERRVWWSAYCLERMMSIESGRPSHVHDEDMDQDELRNIGLRMGYESFFLLLAAQLARIQGHVSTRLFSRRATPPSPREILGITGELDEELTRWVDQVPPNMRPDSDVLTGQGYIMAVQSYFTLQYHSTLTTIHRSALLMNHATHLAVLNHSSDLTQYWPRLRSSAKICAASARKIISTFIDARDEDIFSPLNTFTQPLQAIFVLAIHTLQNPAGVRARNDLNWLWFAADAIEAVRRQERGGGSDRLLPVLLRFAREAGAEIMKRLSAPPPPWGERPSRHHPLRQTIDLTTDGPAPADPHAAVWPTLFPFLFQGQMRLDPGYRPTDAEVRGWLGIPQLSEQELWNLHAQ